MRLNGGTLAAFALLAAGGPFAIDMYLPAFPAIAADLNTTPSLVQLTLSTFMVGMALGQLFVGALSDTRGRHNIPTAEFNVAGNAKSQILGTQGFVKLVSLKDGPILGFHAIGARMGEQVGEGQLMVSWEADADDVASLVHAHPTQNETLGEAAMALAGKPLHNHG